MVQVMERALIVLNVLTFLLMGYDKKKAAGHHSRVPENIFLLLALLGGSAGIWFGMKLFRHKTKHLRFTYGIALIVAVQALALLYLTLRTG